MLLTDTKQAAAAPEDLNGSVDRLQSLLQSLQAQQMKLRQLQQYGALESDDDDMSSHDDHGHDGNDVRHVLFLFSRYLDNYVLHYFMTDFPL
jgi:hypothetical protein